MVDVFRACPKAGSLIKYEDFLLYFVLFPAAFCGVFN